jgi:hypothetical protein
VAVRGSTHGTPRLPSHERGRPKCCRRGARSISDSGERTISPTISSAALRRSEVEAARLQCVGELPRQASEVNRCWRLVRHRATGEPGPDATRSVCSPAWGLVCGSCVVGPRTRVRSHSRRSVMSEWPTPDAALHGASGLFGRTPASVTVPVVGIGSTHHFGLLGSAFLAVLPHVFPRSFANGPDVFPICATDALDRLRSLGVAVELHDE